MEVPKENQLELAVSGSSASPQESLVSQRELFQSQIDQLQNIVLTQCLLTGVNPLSQEMAAGALSIKIGKRPRDLLNPKAVKYMQSVFSVKDAITKRESREISALFGVTVTQVREFFTSQRSRVRKFVRLSREKALRSNASEETRDGIPMSTDPGMPINPVPLNCVGPPSSEGPSCSTQGETFAGLDDSDRHFLENIFNLMRKEETFCGQVKLIEWVLQIQNTSLLYWFLTKGGVMILATWLSQAASEEQTSVLHVILQVLCHLPLHKALPEHMSAILQSVNKLRFYRASDISNRARILLSRWSKMFARSQAMKKPNTVQSLADAQNEMLLKQSISEIMGDGSWESKSVLPEDTLAPLLDGSENFRKSESLQPLKLLPAPSEDFNKKLIRGVSSSQTRERRKVLLVEQPGQKPAGRSLQVARWTTACQGRPLSADDIQKAKMRAQFMQSKYRQSGAFSGEGQQGKTDSLAKISPSQARNLLSCSKTDIRPQVEERKDPVMLPTKVSVQQEAPLGNKDLDEPIWKRCKRVQISWRTPAEVRIDDDWRVGTGENSKEVDVQRNRIRREKETIYRTPQEVPPDPKEPWDREMDYDDTLTLEIPTEQPPDADCIETQVPPRQDEEASTSAVASASAPSQCSNGRDPGPDIELLAVLLENPELVFALTSGQGGGSLSSEDTVKLLDMIKAKGVASLQVASSLTGGLGRKAEENVQVSLPSPTPSSDPVPSGWRPETGKNPFSRQSTIANRDSVAISRVAENYPASNLVPAAEQSTTVPMLNRQAIPQYMLPEKQPLPVNCLPQTRAAVNSPNIPLRSSPLPNLAAAASPMGYIKPTPVSIMINKTEHQPFGYPSAGLLTTPTPLRGQPQPQPHLSRILEPQDTSWRATQGRVPNLPGRADLNTYNGLVGGPVQPPVQLGHPRDGNGLGFETFSPGNSPIRSNEYMPGWNYPEPRTNMGYNYNRSEPARSRPWNSSSEYRDYNRHGNRRWGDRRR